MLASNFFPPPNNQFVTPILDVYNGGDRGPFVIISYPETRSLSLLNLLLLAKREPPLDQSQESERDELRGWTLSVDKSTSPAADENESIESCAMSGDGKTVVAGGSRGTLWFFHDRIS